MENLRVQQLSELYQKINAKDRSTYFSQLVSHFHNIEIDIVQQCATRLEEMTSSLVVVDQELPSRERLKRNIVRPKRFDSPIPSVDGARVGDTCESDGEVERPCRPLEVSDDLQMASGKLSDYCTVCFGNTSVSEDLIVYCEECNIGVHQSCYGIETVPTGEWKCERCLEKKNRADTRCVVCGRVGGAMKPMKQSDQWAHLLCCWWDPDMRVDDTATMGPIAFVRKPSDLRKSTCELCGRSEGYCISCNYFGCGRPIHAVCARQFGYLSLDMDAGIVSQQAFCDRHRETRFRIKDIASGIFQGEDLAEALGKGHMAKLEEIFKRLNDSEFYEAMDNVLKDIVAIFRKPIEQQIKKGTPDPAVSILRKYMMRFLNTVPKLEKVYPSCTLRPEELYPGLYDDKVALKYQDMNVRDSVCAVCSKKFVEDDCILYCQNTNRENGAIHAQHATCVNRQPPPDPLAAATATAAAASAVMRRRKKKKTRVVEENKQTNTLDILRGRCGVCDASMDTRGVLHVTDAKSKRSLRAARGNDFFIPSAGASERGPNVFRMPSMTTIKVAETEQWLTLVEAAVKIWDESNGVSMVEDVMAQHFNSACDLAAISGDKYARSRIKRVVHWLKRGKGPAYATLKVLIRDYRHLILQREAYESEMAEQSRIRREKAELEQKKREEQDRKGRQAELLLKQQQAKIKESLKRKRKPANSKAVKRTPKLQALMTDMRTSKLKTKKKSPTLKLPGQRTRIQRCNSCAGCRAKDCRVCQCCQDMKKYGGSGTRKRSCVKRACLAPISVLLPQSASFASSQFSR